jgi:selT/selW/selH-like putative selenoprotein
LADEINKKVSNVEVELIKGSGGAFEVVKDGELIFSKLKEGRFPEVAEIFSKLS